MSAEFMFANENHIIIIFYCFSFRYNLVFTRFFFYVHDKTSALAEVYTITTLTGVKTLP